MKSFTILEENKQKTERSTLLEIINETLNVEIKGNPDKFINKPITINGKEELVKEIDKLFKEQRKLTKKTVLENLRKENFHFVDLNRINEQIKYLTEELGSRTDVGIPNPEDIFSSEDYQKMPTFK
jgi:hypothetical protein